MLSITSFIHAFFFFFLHDFSTRVWDPGHTNLCCCRSYYSRAERIPRTLPPLTMSTKPLAVPTVHILLIQHHITFFVFQSTGFSPQPSFSPLSPEGLFSWFSICSSGISSRSWSSPRLWMEHTTEHLLCRAQLHPCLHQEQTKDPDSVSLSPARPQRTGGLV